MSLQALQLADGGDTVLAMYADKEELEGRVRGGGSVAVSWSTRHQPHITEASPEAMEGTDTSPPAYV